VHRVRRSALVTLVAVVVVGAASCSSGSGTSGSTTTVPPASVATTSTTAVGGTTSTPPSTTPRPSTPDWPTYYGDNARTGSSTGGPPGGRVPSSRWASPELDGDVYAQPLIVGNRVITATGHDTVYALDAARGAILWQRHLGEPVPASSLPCGDVDPVGITSTPVVDAPTNRVYVVAMLQPKHHELFVLDLRDGHVVASTGVDAPGADPAVHNQRSALTLANGKVYVEFGGRFGDCGDYHGRVVSVAVTAAGLGAVHDYQLPTQGQGGFWTPGGASTARDGSLYLASGNSASRGAYDYGNSVVRLDPDLRLVDSFAAPTWKQDNATDRDLGTSTPVLLPGNLVFQIGKGGIGYLLDAQHLGGIGGQRVQANVCGDSGVWGAVARDGTALAVPCSDAVVLVQVAGGRIARGWQAGYDTPGPPVISRGIVWFVATSRSRLVGLDEATGHEIASLHIGPVPSRFTSPAVGDGMVVVAGSQFVRAFG
jgi:outer membrane protein assembly factor BamB